MSARRLATYVLGIVSKAIDIVHQLHRRSCQTCYLLQVLLLLLGCEGGTMFQKTVSNIHRFCRMHMAPNQTSVDKPRLIFLQQELSVVLEFGATATRMITLVSNLRAKSQFLGAQIWSQSGSQEDVGVEPILKPWGSTNHLEEHG